SVIINGSTDDCTGTIFYQNIKLINQMMAESIFFHFFQGIGDLVRGFFIDRKFLNQAENSRQIFSFALSNGVHGLKLRKKVCPLNQFSTEYLGLLSFLSKVNYYFYHYSAC